MGFGKLRIIANKQRQVSQIMQDVAGYSCHVQHTLIQHTMALRYDATTIGTITIEQTYKEIKQRFTLQIRTGNCLAIIIHVQKDTENKGEEIHTLWTFYVDEQHIKNIMKNEKNLFFGDKVLSIKLNMYYKECWTLLKYYTLNGNKVTYFYKKPKNSTK